MIVLGGVEFEVINADDNTNIGTYFTNQNGEINIENLRTGTYRIIEKKTNKWYKLAEEVKVEIKWNELTEVKIQNELKKGQIKVTKVDSENEEIKLKDVKFEVLDQNGNILETINTDENGEATTKAYPIRDYEKIYLKEKTTNDNYVLDDSMIEVKLEENMVQDIKVKNEYKKGNLRIKKLDKDNKETVLPNVVFDLYSEKENKIVGTYSTNENGEIYIENLKIGKYKIIEKKTNEWYNLAEETEVEIKHNEAVEVTVENELKKGKIKIIKEDSENEEIKLKDVEFEVLNDKGNILETIKTDENGEATTKAYPLRDYQKLYLKEISTDENYVLDDKQIEVILKENETQEIIVKNEKIKGQIKITKISSENSVITGHKKGEALEGFTFEIYNSKDDFVEKLTTDKNGEAITSKLERGEYKIKETDGNEWYYINPKIFNVTINNNNEIINLKLTNEPKSPEIQTEKIGNDRVEVGKQIEYDISMKNSGNTILDNFTWIDNIPYEYINVTKFQTGTYNQKLKYNLYYKTNLSNDEYILILEDLNTIENYEIDFEEELADNEFVTGIKLEFGTVDIGFSSNENPHLLADVKSTLKSETTFVNYANIRGSFNGYEVKDASSWKTLVYKLLPKTGF